MNVYLLFSVFCVVLAVTSLISVLSRDLMVAVVSYAVFGLVMAVMFFLLDAPDVAIAEASIGAALTVCIFVMAIRMTRRREE